MFDSLPNDARAFKDWEWAQIEPYYADLEGRSLTPDIIHLWMLDWTRLLELVEETQWRLYADRSADTTDAAADAAFNRFVDQIQPQVRAADQRLKQKLLASGLEAPGFEIPLRNMRSDAVLFREENLPLLAEEAKLAAEYGKITGSQSVEFEGELRTLPSLQTVYVDRDRDRRQRAWEAAAQRRLQDKDALTALWQRLFALRRQIAQNAGQPSFREYRWRQLYRFDYTPDDCASFHNAIEQVVVPAASEINARRKQRLGVDTLRPWDVLVDPSDKPPLQPFSEVSDLVDRVGAMFQHLDPTLAAYFDLMRRENLLDLANRPNKAPGAWCTSFSSARRPYIFMNAVGLHDDVMTLVHESGHAFHWCEAYAQPYFHQRGLDFIPIEMMEVGSMSMEYLTAPYLTEAEGGFYSVEDAARARIEHLEGAILFWPYMAVVDAFQHWAYTHPENAVDPQKCDAQWTELRTRFQPDVDWSGYEDALANGWQEKLHIYEVPFYYVEYGLAQLGAVQVWRNALSDLPGAVAKYRQALALGITRPLPQLFAAAGAKFAFDSATLRECVGLMRDTMDHLAGTPV